MRLSIADQPNTKINWSSRFANLAVIYCEYASNAGFDLKPFRNDSLSLFNSLSQQEQQSSVEALQACVQICEAHVAEGLPIYNSPKLIWNALKRLGLRPPSDLFNHITHDSVIEVYSSEGIQIFRSFNFYKFCSYSLEELYCTPWYLLYKRVDEVTEQLKDTLIQFFSGQLRDTQYVNLKAHPVKELLSPGQNEVMVGISHIAPLFSTNGSNANPIAVLAIESAEFANQSRLYFENHQTVTPLFSEPASASNRPEFL